MLAGVDVASSVRAVGAGGGDTDIVAAVGGGKVDAGIGIGASVDGRSGGAGVCPRLERSRAIRSSGVSSLIGYLRSRP